MTSELARLREENAALKKERDCGYTERNRLVCFLTKIFPSYLAPHPAEDESWDDKWRTIVFVESPHGQLSWHLHDTDVPLFSHLPEGINDWDGHTTEQKYERLSKCGFGCVLQRRRKEASSE